MQDYQLFSIGIEESILTMVHKLRNTVEKLIFFKFWTSRCCFFQRTTLSSWHTTQKKKTRL